MRRPSKTFRLSILLAASLACTYLALVHRQYVTQATLPYTLDGSTPWGSETRRDADGHPPVLIYTRDSPSTYCFDAIFYEPLRQRLLASRPASVRVEYGHFRNFFLEPNYNVQSIDGVVLADGDKILVDEWVSEGGTMETPDALSDHQAIKPCPR